MAFYRASGGDGGGKVAFGTFTPSQSDNTEINCGFRPKYVCCSDATQYRRTHIYNSDFSTSQIWSAFSTRYSTLVPFPQSAINALGDITDNGFVYNKANAKYTVYYFAVG